MIKVRKLSESEFAKLSTKDQDTGYDLFLTEDQHFLPGEPVMVKHGIAIELPEGYAATIRPRSSTLLRTETLIDMQSRVDQIVNEDGTVSIRHNLVKMATPLVVQFGTVDHGYRGELMTIAVNITTTPIMLSAGDRISQLTIEKVEKMDVVYAEELSDTERGADGFGSTGTGAPGRKRAPRPTKPSK